jgi:hypothetical protein
MIVMLPTVGFRIVLIALAVFSVAIVNTIAIGGW